MMTSSKMSGKLLAVVSIALCSLVGVPPAEAATESVVYAFAGGTDGAHPVGLLAVGDTLYGTTTDGGAHGHGTVFTLSLTGRKTIIHSFAGGADGATPNGPLIEVGGVLYGTTLYGGHAGYGTVFSITPSGAERVLYAFKGGQGPGADGTHPGARLLYASGFFYGTTVEGGYPAFCPKLGCGTIFKITAAGAYSQLWTFVGPTTDGALPAGGLVLGNLATQEKQLTLYGTTYAGGATFCPGGCGTTFFVTAGGNYDTLYAFHNDIKRDGVNPIGDLVHVNGMTYGATQAGGLTGFGTVYGWAGLVGAVKTLYTFQGGDDGAAPEAGLVSLGGTLYGTTAAGGPNHGQGTVFALTTAGAKTTLWTFSGANGAAPNASMIALGGKLFGTTQGGGRGGNGVVYRITP